MDLVANCLLRALLLDHRWQPPVGHWRFVRWWLPLKDFFNFMELNIT